MIAIATHQVAQVALGPGVVVLAVAVAHLGNAPHVERFVDDQQAELIGEFEQLGRWRIVAGPNGIDTGGLENLELALRGTPIHRSPECSQIVVETHSLQLDRPAVENEATLPVEGDRAHAEGRDIAVDDLPCDGNLRHQRIEVGMVGVPPHRPRQVQMSRQCA